MINKKHQLINVKYFGGLYEGTENNQKLWNDVWNYISENYEIDKVKKIYINGDGASWIKAGAKIINNSKFILDKFHMHKYIIAATSHLGEEVEMARSALYRAIKKRSKQMAKYALEVIKEKTKSESKLKTVEATETYILENWAGIMEQLKNKEADIKN